MLGYAQHRAQGCQIEAAGATRVSRSVHHVASLAWPSVFASASVRQTAHGIPHSFWQLLRAIGVSLL
jgi:hypothetical protein